MTAYKLMTCVAAAMVALGQYAGIQARERPHGAPKENYGTYDASASTINALFLSIGLFGITWLRSARPALYIPSIQFIIFILIGFTYGPNQTYKKQSLVFVRELLYTFLTGQAISAGVSLLLIPVSSRQSFLIDATKFLQHVSESFQASQPFVESLGHFNMKTDSKSFSDKTHTLEYAKHHQKIEAFRLIVEEMRMIIGKLQINIKFSRQEMAYGHFSGADLQDFYGCLRRIWESFSNLSTIVDVSERLCDCLSSKWSARCPAEDHDRVRGPIQPKTTNEGSQCEQQERDDLMKDPCVSFKMVTTLLDKAILHICILLQLIPTAVQRDSPATGEAEANLNSILPELGSKELQFDPKPGELGYSAYLDGRMVAIRESRMANVKFLAELDSLKPGSTQNCKSIPVKQEPDFAHPEKCARHSSFVLYIEDLFWPTADSILELAHYAESKYKDETMKKQRFIRPRWSRVLKWMLDSFVHQKKQTIFENLDEVSGDAEAARPIDSWQNLGDAEYLHPTTKWQSYGDCLRAIPRVLSSDPAKFAVCMTVPPRCCF